MQATKEPGIDQDLLTLSRSPEFKVKTYKSYDIQGFKFRKKSSEESNCTQNSGVIVLATTTSYTGVHDSYPRERDLTYYGVIKDIIELSFDDGRKKIVLFERDWADNNKIKTDKYGFTLVVSLCLRRKLVPSFYRLRYCKPFSCRIHATCCG